MQCIYRCIWDFPCIQSGDSVHPANKHSSMTMTHLSWILCVSGSEWRREVKGLSDGNVLLRTGHGAGAGVSSALQPGKWLCPVLVAPASNTHTQTHLCVCVHASHWQGRYSLHKRVPSQSLTCSASQERPGTGMGVRPLLVLITTRHIQPKAEVQSGCLWQSPCTGQPCRPPSSALHSAPATAKWILKRTPKSLHDPKSQDTHQVIQIERMTSRRLPGRKRQQVVIAFKKIFVFKRILCNQGEWYRNLPWPQLFQQSMTEYGSSYFCAFSMPSYCESWSF